MADGSRLTRRLFLRCAALAGAGLATGSLGQACLWRPSDAQPASAGCGPTQPSSLASASTPLPVVSIPPVSPLQDASPGNPAISHLVMIVVDGMMPEYLGLGSFPRMESLINGGTSFGRAWVGQVVNNTPVSHVSLVSGQLPRRTGVVYFSWRDPNTGRMLRLMTTQQLESGSFAALMRDQDVPSIGKIVKQHRPGAKVVAVGSTKDFAPVTMALDAADYVGYAVRIPAAEAGLLDERELSGEALPTRDKKADKFGLEVNNEEAAVKVRKLMPGGPDSTPLPGEMLCDPKYTMITREVGDNDDFAMNLALGLFAAQQPQVLLINLPDNDQIGHLTGGHTTNPKPVTQVMANADAQIGRLIDAYRAAGLYERTLWVITSDHGMTPNTVNIPPSFADLTLKDDGYQRVGGDTAHYWLKIPSEAPAAATAIDERQTAGFYGTYFKVDEGNGRFHYEPTRIAAERLSPRTRAAMEWLLETFASAQSPELTFVLGENVHFHKKPLNTVGAHSEATWGLQKIPLILSGPGVRAGHISSYPARLVDVAPTVLALMGLPAGDMDGTPLRDALASSTEQVRAEQLSAPETRRMLRYQETLMDLGTPSL